MNLRRLTSTLAICVSVIAGHAVAGSPPPRELNGTLTWIRKPGPRDLDELYPPLARERNLGGWALMRCRLNARGRTEDCRIAAEAPTGVGFGAMALKLSKNFQAATTTTDGVPVEGGYVTIPVTLTGNGRAIIPDKTYSPGEPGIMLAAPKTADGKPDPQPCSAIDLSGGRCSPHRLSWVEIPDLSQIAPIVRGAAQTTGKTALTCTVGDAGALRDCMVVGDATPGSRLAMLEIAGRLQAVPKTNDGLTTEGQRVLALFDWAAMTNTYDALFPQEPTP